MIVIKIVIVIQFNNHAVSIDIDHEEALKNEMEM